MSSLEQKHAQPPYKRYCYPPIPSVSSISDSCASSLSSCTPATSVLSSQTEALPRPPMPTLVPAAASAASGSRSESRGSAAQPKHRKRSHAFLSVILNNTEESCSQLSPDQPTFVDPGGTAVQLAIEPQSQVALPRFCNVKPADVNERHHSAQGAVPLKRARPSAPFSGNACSPIASVVPGGIPPASSVSLPPPSPLVKTVTPQTLAPLEQKSAAQGPQVLYAPATVDTEQFYGQKHHVHAYRGECNVVEERPFVQRSVTMERAGHPREPRRRSSPGGPIIGNRRVREQEVAPVGANTSHLQLCGSSGNDNIQGMIEPRKAMNHTPHLSDQGHREGQNPVMYYSKHYHASAGVQLHEACLRSPVQKQLHENPVAAAASVATRPWVCGICHMRFGRKSSLSRHESTVHRRQRFKCRMCSKSYSQKYDTVKHERKAHGMDRGHPMVSRESPADATNNLSIAADRLGHASVHGQGGVDVRGNGQRLGSVPRNLPILRMQEPELYSLVARR